MIVQCQVLNKVIKNRDASIIIDNNLDESFFSDYKEEYNFIINFMEKYDNTVPDLPTFLDKFDSFTVMDSDVQDSYLIDELNKDKESRILTDAFNKVRDLLLSGKSDEAREILEKTNEDLVTSKPLESVDIFQDDSRYDEYVKRKDDISSYYVTTGLIELDNLIGGWDRKEELATIVARTNQGKSWLLLKSAFEAAKKGLNVGLYSGEMSAQKVGYRLDTIRTHISNSGITRGKDEVNIAYRNYIKEEMKSISGHIRVITPKECGGPATVNTLRTFIEKYHLDMLCIDQHSLMEDRRNAKNPIDRAANISKDLKNLQVLTGIPIITVSQQNRNSTENGISTTHIAQSDRIGQDSTVVLAFEQKDGVLTITVLKARDAAAGAQLQYAIDFDKGTFNFIPADSSMESELTEEYGEEPF